MSDHFAHFEVWIVANRLESLEKWWDCVIDAMTIINWEGTAESKLSFKKIYDCIPIYFKNGGSF